MSEQPQAIEQLPAIEMGDEALVQALDMAIDELAKVIEQENALLHGNGRPDGNELSRRKMALVNRYQMLTTMFRPRARQLHSAGLFNSEELADRIRHLLTLLRDNQRRLLNRERVARDRIQAVMDAVAEPGERNAPYSADAGRTGVERPLSVGVNARI